MKPLRLIAVAAAVCVGGVSGQAAVPPAPQAPLRLCADPANLPFSSNEPAAVADGMPGAYVEIGQAVAEALGRPLEVVWSLSYFGKRNLRTTLLAGRCDLAVGLPADPDFMGPRLLFTQPILKVGYAIVVPRGSKVRGVDDLAGQRVAVQFASPPQSVLAARSDVASITVMDPEEGMRLLAAGNVDAAFVWGPSAGYLNQAKLGGAYALVPVEAPQMQWEAAIGVSSKQPELRDQIDAALKQLGARVHDVGVRYAMAGNGPLPALPEAGAKPIVVAAADAAPQVATAAASGNVDAGKEIFNSTCAHCHGPDGVVADRKINLRRLHEKYGDEMEKVYYATVTDGRPAKGMPAWKEVYKAQDFDNILAYLKTLQGK